MKIVDDRSRHGGPVKVNIHPHALARIKERGCTRADVEYTVKHGLSSPAKYGRTRFTHTFAYIESGWIRCTCTRPWKPSFSPKDTIVGW